jgi:cbb3-type cytochrome oxidase subunit 3
MSVLIDAAHWFQAHSILAMLAIFVLLGVWVYAPSRKSSMEQFARIPLEDEG